MPQLFASQSSRFFAVREPGSLRLYKGPALELRHRVNDKLAGKLVRLGNNGDAFFRNAQNVYRLKREPNVKAQRPRVLAHLDGSREGGILGGFAVNADGREFCYEQVLPAKRTGSTLLGLLGKQPEKVKVTQRSLVLCNSISGQSVTFYEAVVDPGKMASFRWAISPTFGFLVVAESDTRGETVCRLIDVIDESVCSEFVIGVERIDSLRVTDNGTVMMEVRVPGQERLVLWTYSQDRYLVALPVGCNVHHFDHKRIVLASEDRRFLIVKAYDDTVEANIDLGPLLEFNLDFLPHFTPKGGIELATFESGRFRVHHTDVETLPIDASRWKMLQEQRRLEEEQQMLEQATAAQKQDEERLQYLRRSRALEDSIKTSLDAPTIKPSEPTPTPNRLELDLPGQVEPTPDRLEPPGRLRPPVSPAPPARLDVGAKTRPIPSKLEVKPTLGKKKAGDSLAVEATRSLQPAFEQPTLAARERTLAQNPTVANEAPTLLDPAKVEPADLGTLSQQDIEQSLEALRMHYIAGELKREDYYRKKKELEDLKGRGEAPQSDPTPSSSGMMESKRIELGGP